MKKLAIFPALVLATAILIYGCGKSEEFKKMESTLYSSVMTLHDEGMTLMNKGSDLSAKIDAAMAQYDSLAAKYPKQFQGHSSDDLKAAKEKITGATSSLKEWMSSLKPYDPAAEHTEVMAQLTKEKDSITTVNADFQDAISAATAALDNHKALAESLTAKVATAVKKVTKK
jgi:hypothetical protein